ncbi:hypothetical protein D3C72_1139680 [compost metagenome]
MRLAIRWGEGALLVGEQFEIFVVCGGHIVGTVIRSTERNPAHQHGRQRFGLHGKAVGTDIDVDAAGIPETGVFSDERVVRRVNEHLDIHPFAFGVEGVGDDLADRNLAVINR